MGCLFLAWAFYVHIGTCINTDYVDCNDLTICCPLRIEPTCVSNHLGEYILWLPSHLAHLKNPNNCTQFTNHVHHQSMLQLHCVDATDRVRLLLVIINIVFLHSNIEYPQSFNSLRFSVSTLGNIRYYFWNDSDPRIKKSKDNCKP